MPKDDLAHPKTNIEIPCDAPNRCVFHFERRDEDGTFVDDPILDIVKSNGKQIIACEHSMWEYGKDEDGAFFVKLLEIINKW